jgi:hypothetical protein
MAGVSVAGEIETLTPEIKKIAEQINKKLSFMGLWWFQIKKDMNEKWKLLEISTRCAGTMALTRACGVNLPLLSVYIAMGYSVSVEPNAYHVTMDSSLIRRYKIDYDYDTVYFDFDDTLQSRKGAYRLYCESFLSKYFPGIDGEERLRKLDEMEEYVDGGYKDREVYFPEIIELWNWEDHPPMQELYDSFNYDFGEIRTPSTL